MKTIKPLKLALLTHCYEHRRRFFLGVSIMAFVPLGKEPSLLSEMELWKFAAEELGKDSVLDAGIPKIKSEYLVSGFAFIPEGKQGKACLVRARFGGPEKLLHVFGDRFWRGAGSSEPLPFSKMPLDWTHTFGGEGFDRNPLGKGVGPVTANNVTVHPLANVQYATQTPVSPDDRPEPASFGPVDYTWPQRFSKAGTYDDQWLKEDFPGFARDIDWTIFNIAPPDQWLDRPIQPDEPYFFENMHPSKPILEGRLPDIATRCFVNRRTENGDVFLEVPTGLTTVWFFPHAEKAVLIFQGSTGITEDDGADVSQIIAAFEKNGSPKDTDHYRQVLAARMDKDTGHLASLREGDLLPSGMDLPVAALEEEKRLSASEGLLSRNMRRKAEAEIQRARDIVAGLGLDPEQYGPPPLPPEEAPPETDKLPEYFEKMDREVEKHKQAAEAQRIEREKQTERLCAEAGIDYRAFQEQQKLSAVGPPKFSADGTMRQITGLIEDGHKHGMVMAEVETMVADPAYLNKLQDLETRLKESYRITAHHQTAAPAMDGSRSAEIRNVVVQARGRGESLAGFDLTGADLSGLDLEGINLEGAFLESANFDGTNLKGANLKNAVLAHASFRDATLTESMLTGANLGGALLVQIRAHGADFSNTILAHADFTGADLNGSRLQGADCSGALFLNADFSNIQAGQLVFLESKLNGLTLKGANLDKCNFLKVDATGVDFSDASLKSATFLESIGKGASFRGADMTKMCFVQACSFEAADFSNGSLKSANFRGASLDGCNFTGARLDGADMSGCSLRGATFHRASALDARFVKTDLNGATMVSVNAANALFQGADIRGTDLRGSNLFQADLARVRANSSTNLTDALTKKVRVYPRRQHD